MMDVSGSMGRTSRRRSCASRRSGSTPGSSSQYKGLETRYIVHDAAAREVDARHLLSPRESRRARRFPAAYKLCARDHRGGVSRCPTSGTSTRSTFSDGDNWSAGRDTEELHGLAEKTICSRRSNVFCYGQVKSAYGSGQFIKDLEERFRKRTSADHWSDIPEDKDGILRPRSRTSWARVK